MAGVNGRKRRRYAAEINVVPYIDVMLVLLVIFMVTAPLLTQGVNVELPQASASPLPSTEKPLTFSVDAAGKFYLEYGQKEDEPLADADLVAKATAILHANPDTVILVHADKSVAYDRVLIGMTLLQQAGANKLGFETRPGGSGEQAGASPQAPSAKGATGR
jgi:biopolymer transport protein TolR